MSDDRDDVIEPTADEIELKPCPFCEDPMENSGSIIRHVHQGDCIIGQLAYDETKRDKWDRRASPPAPAVAVPEGWKDVIAEARGEDDSEYPVSEERKKGWHACVDQIETALSLLAAAPTLRRASPPKKEEGFQAVIEAREDAKGQLGTLREAMRLRRERASPPAPAVAVPETDTIRLLIDLTRATDCMLDNSEDDGERLIIERSDYEKVGGLLDMLDALPDDQPGYTMGPAAKAEWSLRRLLAAPTPPAAEAPGQDGFSLEQVKAEIAEGSGIWRTCSGCHDTEDGYPTRQYAYSKAFGCSLGCGCMECGGIGAVWDDTDYEKMAEVIAEEILAEEAAKDAAAEAPGQEPVAWLHRVRPAHLPDDKWSEWRIGRENFTAASGIEYEEHLVYFAPPASAEAEARAFARGIEVAAKWHDGRVKEAAEYLRNLPKRIGLEENPEWIAWADTRINHTDHAIAIRSLASPAPKGET